MCRLMILLSLACVLAFSCQRSQNVKQTEPLVEEPDTVQIEEYVDTFVIEEAPIPVAADELFDDFFFNFVADSRLQKKRIAFPLIVKNDTRDTDTILSGQWVKENFFADDGRQTLIVDSEAEVDLMKDTEVDSVVVEKILLNIQTVRQHIFKRQNGVWRLMSINDQPFYKNHNAEFFIFYHKFAVDSVFQVQSLARPVQFSSPNPDDDFSRIEGLITTDTWDAFSPDLPKEVIYNVVYCKSTSADTQSTASDSLSENKKKLFFIRGISNGEETEMEFDYDGEKWQLVRLDI